MDSKPEQHKERKGIVDISLVLNRSVQWYDRRGGTTKDTVVVLLVLY